jgi:aryl-alcohol dehydrogenase-like predicted oxidoreductase
MRHHLLRDGRTELSVSAICLGTMYFGTTISEETSYALLDRYVAAGGNFLDTANCYAFWAEGANPVGGESEALLGRWLRSRGLAGVVRVASKVGAGPARPDEPYDAHNREGLSRRVVLEQARASRERLGVERIDLYYAHADDRSTPLEETLGAFGELVDEGTVGMVAASNYAAWRLALARDVADRNGLPRYAAIQQRHTYLEPRPIRTPYPDAIQLPVTDDLTDYAAAHPDLTVLAYSPLLNGAYTRADRPLHPYYDHPGSPSRLAVLNEVAKELGATVNQVVLAWLLGGERPILPVIGVSTIAQLDECLESVDLVLDPATRERLDNAGE